MIRKWNISLTYEPKIEPVQKGEINQTIRIIGKSGMKHAGDLISLHGWQGAPYRSPWSFRTPYTKITEAISCEIYDAGMWIDPAWCKKTSGKFWWCDLDWLAALDGIVPATGEELKWVLMEKNPLSNAYGKDAQIIRWLPTTPGAKHPQEQESKELQEIREMFAELERKEKHLAAFREVMKL